MRSPSRWPVALVLLVVLALAGCGIARTAGPPAPQTTVRVENRAWLDMNVYVLRGTQRVRLGNVTANSTRVLPIPQRLIFGATALRFLADPIGGRRNPISHEIVVRPGDQVTLYIPNQ